MEDPVVDGLPNADVRLRLGRNQALELVAVSPLTTLGVEVTPNPKFFKALEPKESPDTDAVRNVDETLRSETVGALVVAAEWLDIDALLSTDEDELIRPVPLLVPFGRFVESGTSVKGT